MMDEQTPKWQPVMLVLDNRLECRCGTLAIFVSGKLVNGHYNQLEEVDVWCQDCFQKEQEGNISNDAMD